MKLNEVGIQEYKKLNVTREDEKQVHKIIVNLSRKQRQYKSNSYEVLTAIYAFMTKTNYTPKDIATFFDCSTIAIQDRARLLGVSLDRFEAQRRASLKRNYPEILRKIKLSKAKSIANSNREDCIRYLFYYYLKEMLDCEVIVGINSPSLVDRYELDIPIIIFFKDKVFKIGIEVDFNWCHSDMGRVKNKRDIFKSYKVFNMVLSNNATANQMQESTIETCKQIKLYLTHS